MLLAMESSDMLLNRKRPCEDAFREGREKEKRKTDRETCRNKPGRIGDPCWIVNQPCWMPFRRRPPCIFISSGSLIFRSISMSKRFFARPWSQVFESRGILGGFASISSNEFFVSSFWRHFSSRLEADGGLSYMSSGALVRGRLSESSKSFRTRFSTLRGKTCGGD